MAATGGGKIRSRRYHIASKPYAKSKQQQPGLISRVTDTVKSIVPSWLQKYFNNGEAAEVDEAVQAPEHNSQPLPPNGSEVGPSPLDGWDSSEPSTSHAAEPSTSRASLNYQESSLSRPPLNRSNLHFPPLDAASPVLGSSSSPFTQPSTSKAPGPFSTAPGPSTSVASGPSTSMAPGPFSMGFSLVKEIKDNLSQHEDDNISTTSGFSSRASDKDVPTSKPTSIPRLWSPEIDRTNCGPQHAHSSLKKPAFNLSVFGTSSNSTLNSSVLTSSQLGDSPFYPGKTTYGGASAARSSRTRPTTPYQAPLRRQIKAKPAGTQPCGVTSATARRILQSLERMSSPLADAKRIPSANSSPMSVSMDGTNLDLSHFQSKKKRLDSPFPPVQKLVIPAAASISGNRSLSFRPSLTPGGVGRTLDRPYRDTPTRQSLHIREESPGPSRSTSSSSGPVYPLSSTPAATSTGPGGGGKMKRERTSTRPSSRRPEDEEAAEVPDLPAISLPISAFSLPILNFSTPPPPVATASSATPGPPPATPARQPAADQASPKASTPPCTPFTFSSPIVKATAASPPSFSPSAGFTFSAPVAKMGPSMSNGKLVSPIVTLVKSATSNSTEEFEGCFKPAKSLKQGSVLDILKAPGFSSAGASSGSNAAPQQNPLNAVSTTPPPATPSSAKGFGHLFKPPVGSWSCDVCLVQNKPSDTKCVACTTPQPRPPASNPSDMKPVAGVASDTASPPSKTSAGFGAAFAKPAGTWDCDTCLVQNRPEAVKCVACETAKPGTGVKSSLAPRSVFWPAQTSAAPPGAMAGFGDKFKKAEGAWECDTCMVENKAQDAKCVACMSAKPGASVSSAAPAPASSAPALGFGDKFKKPEGAWDCDVCCVQNKAADVQCVACQTARPGAKVEPKGFGSSTLGSAGSSAVGSAGSGGFKFGATSESTSESGGFKFGGTHPDSSSTSGGFKFRSTFGGSTSDITSKDTSNSAGFKFGGSTEGFTFGAASTLTTDSADKKSDSGFKFGNGSGIAFGSGTSNTASKPSNGGFSFGLSKPDVTTRCTDVTAPPAAFTLPASCQMTIGSGASSTDSTSTSTTTATTTSSSSGASVFSRLGESSRAATPLGGATFSSSTAEKEPAAATFTFGKPEEKEAATSASTAAPAGFMFSAASKEPGNTSSTATLGGFSFNNPDPPKEAPAPAFTFGKPADKSERTAQDAPKPAFTFGQSAAETPAAPKAGFSFDATVTTSSTPVSSLFGSSSTQVQAPTASLAAGGGGFIFGSSASSSASDAASAKAFVFGQSQDGQTSTSPASAMNSSPAPAPSQPFLFGAATNPAPPVAATPFAFGGAAPSAASSAATAAAHSPFVFSSAPSGGFGASQAPSSLGSPAPPAFSTFGCSSQAPAFGVKPTAAAPVFGHQTNPALAFSAGATSTPGGGFQFGGASAFGACSTGVFSFGAGNTGSPAPPAVPSLTPQPPAAGGGFVFQQPPAFNIGSAKSSFAAAPPAGTPTIAGRKIKTAVRRRK